MKILGGKNLKRKGKKRKHKNRAKCLKNCIFLVINSKDFREGLDLSTLNLHSCNSTYRT